MLAHLSILEGTTVEDDDHSNHDHGRVLEEDDHANHDHGDDGDAENDEHAGHDHGGSSEDDHAGHDHGGDILVDFAAIAEDVALKTTEAQNHCPRDVFCEVVFEDDHLKRFTGKEEYFNEARSACRD